MIHNGAVRRVFSLSLVVALLVAIVIIDDVVSPGSAVDPLPRAAERAQNAPLRVAVVGDSLSAGRSHFSGNGLDDESWMTYAKGDALEYVGGWARSGATPGQMAAAVRPIRDVDVLVVLAGTNAVRDGKTLPQVAEAYEQIVAVVHPKHVIVSRIPPYRAHAQSAVRYNDDLRRLTESRGWSWADPWAVARDGDDWAPGFSVDGTHPAGPAQYAVLGESFRQIILGTQVLPSALG